MQVHDHQLYCDNARCRRFASYHNKSFCSGMGAAATRLCCLATCLILGRQLCMPYCNSGHVLNLHDEGGLGLRCLTKLCCTLYMYHDTSYCLV